MSLSEVTRTASQRLIFQANQRHLVMEWIRTDKKRVAGSPVLPLPLPLLS